MIFILKYWKQLAALVLAVGLFVSGWIVNGWRLDAKIQADKIEAQEKARKVEQQWNERLNIARDEYAKREAKNKIAVDRARFESDSLRDELREMSANSSKAVCIAASTALGYCVGEYQKLAQDSDRCENEKQQLDEAWPNTPKSE